LPQPLPSERSRSTETVHHGTIQRGAFPWPKSRPSARKGKKIARQSTALRPKKKEEGEETYFGNAGKERNVEGIQAGMGGREGQAKKPPAPRTFACLDHSGHFNLLKKMCTDRNTKILLTGGGLGRRRPAVRRGAGRGTI